jgi:hypothetical protein
VRDPRSKRKTSLTTLTWDLSLDGGLGAALRDHTALAGFGRIRGGLLYIDETDLAYPTLYSLGLTYEASSITPVTAGIEGEVLLLSSGLWLQIGAMVDWQPRPAFTASVGWSIFGAETQVRWDAGDGKQFWVFYGKLRLPIRAIVWAALDR